MAYDIRVTEQVSESPAADLGRSLTAAKNSIETLLRDWRSLDERSRLQLLSVALISIHQTGFSLQRAGSDLASAGAAGGMDTDLTVYRLPDS